MNNFQIIEIVGSDKIKVSPSWTFKLKDGNTFSGNKIKIRGLDPSSNHSVVMERLKKLLLDTNQEVQFLSPELIDTNIATDAVVSCSVYLSKTNITYYFPEFVHKD